MPLDLEKEFVLFIGYHYSRCSISIKNSLILLDHTVVNLSAALTKILDTLSLNFRLLSLTFNVRGR